MLTNETESKREERGNAAIIQDTSSCVGREGTRCCTTCKASCRVLGSSLLDARCVISVPGQTFEVPALFMAWMFDEPGNENTQEPQNKPRDIFTERKIPCLVLTSLATNDWHYLSGALAPRQTAESANRPKPTFPKKTLKEIP
ncbi:hypothetical protein OAG63_00775 [Methylacidiphilales bacterium]|nr:hypothetical protein [Candidatus Methylacidiphilales bacterium]